MIQHQRHVLNALHDGAVIRVEHVNLPTSGAKRSYRLSSNQQPIKEALVMRMVADCLIKPNGDGLFGNEGPVQSYSLWRASEGGA